MKSLKRFTKKKIFHYSKKKKNYIPWLIGQVVSLPNQYPTLVSKAKVKANKHKNNVTLNIFILISVLSIIGKLELEVQSAISPMSVKISVSMV